MDTENQQWLCEFCNKNYSLNRKDKHLLTKVHKKNKKRYELDEILEEYEIRRDVLLAEKGDMTYEEFVKQSKLVDKKLKAEFGRNYKVE